MIAHLFRNVFYRNMDNLHWILMQLQVCRMESRVECAHKSQQNKSTKHYNFSYKRKLYRHSNGEKIIVCVIAWKALCKWLERKLSDANECRNCLNRPKKLKCTMITMKVEEKSLQMHIYLVEWSCIHDSLCQCVAMLLHVYYGN